MHRGSLYLNKPDNRDVALIVILQTRQYFQLVFILFLWEQTYNKFTVSVCLLQKRVFSIFNGSQKWQKRHSSSLCIALTSGASVNVWTFFNICVWVPQLSSVWKDGSQNPTVTAGKGSKICRFFRTWRIFLKSSAQFNCSDKQWTHEQPSKTFVDHPGNHTQY